MSDGTVDPTDHPAGSIPVNRYFICPGCGAVAEAHPDCRNELFCDGQDQKHRRKKLKMFYRDRVG
jgi:hypothetical protein